MIKLLLLLLLGLTLLAVGIYTMDTQKKNEGYAELSADRNLKKAIFAGGCFWCMEPPFQALDGVRGVVSGYTGGHIENPTYEQVSSGGSGHLEAIMVFYDPAKLSYERLLEVFWRQIDPTDPGGQFVDRGPQYGTAVFYLDAGQKEIAEKSKRGLEASGRFEKPVVTAILPAAEFYPAEDYHQDYHNKSPVRYDLYRRQSGRDNFLKKTWPGESDTGEKKSCCGSGLIRPSDEELKKILTDTQYKVARQNGTELPFLNEYWKNKEPGIYVDVVSGEPLFSSRDKFDSGTGWPSFTRPLVSENIVEKVDQSHGMTRVEVRSKHGDSHLGHVFPDGPEPTGFRYCINSASLRFVPKSELEDQGYGEFADSL